MTRWIADLLGAGENGWRIAMILYVGVGVPLLAMLSFLSLVSRFGPVLLSLAVPVLSVVIALLVCLPIAIMDGIDSAVRQVFWPTQLWFAVSGFVLIGVITYLRRRGVIFAFGTDRPGSRVRWKTTYAASLRGRIDRHKRELARLQTELDALGTVK